MVVGIYAFTGKFDFLKSENFHNKMLKKAKLQNISQHKYAIKQDALVNKKDYKAVCTEQIHKINIFF